MWGSINVLLHKGEGGGCYSFEKVAYIDGVEILSVLTSAVAVTVTLIVVAIVGLAITSYMYVQFNHE